MGYLYRPKLRNGTRGKIWRAKYYVAGRPVRESTGTDERKEAERFLKAREGAVAVGAPIPPRLDKILYDELAADLVRFYETTGTRKIEEVKDRLRYLEAFFRRRRAVTIGSTLITQYAAQRQQARTRSVRAPSNRTINIELAILKRMLRLAAAADPPKLLRVPKICMLKESPPREGFFEDHQYEAVRRQLPEDLQVAVAVAHTYGWRVRSEVLPLERRHLDLKVGTLRLDPGTTKNSEGRVVYLTPHLKAMLAVQVDRVRSLERKLGRVVPHLFPHLAGSGAGERRRSFAKRWRTACRKAGVPGRIPHDFRRTAVRNLERRRVARSVAMKITGHKTENVYRRYAIVSDAELRDAAVKLAVSPDSTQGHTSGHTDQAAVDTLQVNAQNS